MEKTLKIAKALMKAHKDWTWAKAYQRAEMLVNAQAMKQKREESGHSVTKEERKD